MSFSGWREFKFRHLLPFPLAVPAELSPRRNVIRHIVFQQKTRMLRKDLGSCTSLSYNVQSDVLEERRSDGKNNSAVPVRVRTAMAILLGLLITILVIFLVLYLINMLPLDAKVKQIAQVIVIIIGIISLLKYLAVF